MNPLRRFASIILPVAVGLSTTGCASTDPALGDPGAKTVATGAAGGASAVGANRQLEHCDRSLGTLTIVEDANQPWVRQLMTNYKLSAVSPLLRLMIHQSNCFVVVERGQATQQMQDERDLARAGELRARSNMGKGQMVAADYTLTPSVTFSQAGSVNFSAFGGGNLGAVVSLIGGSFRKNESATTLLLSDNRTGIQLAAAEGSASNWDMGAIGGLFNGGGAAGGGFSKTPEGKLLAAAFADALNTMIRALRSYKAQEVAGGLGTGGALKTN